VWKRDVFEFEEVLCRWIAVAEIVTENRAAFVAALDWLDDASVSHTSELQLTTQG
jgi:hypothetical protein